MGSAAHGDGGVALLRVLGHQAHLDLGRVRVRDRVRVRVRVRVRAPGSSRPGYG